MYKYIHINKRIFANMTEKVLSTKQYPKHSPPAICMEKKFVQPQNGINVAHHPKIFSKNIPISNKVHILEL